jgi:hypothetical protein
MKRFGGAILSSFEQKKAFLMFRIAPHDLENIDWSLRLILSSSEYLRELINRKYASEQTPTLTSMRATGLSAP